MLDIAIDTIVMRPYVFAFLRYFCHMWVGARPWHLPLLAI